MTNVKVYPPLAAPEATGAQRSNEKPQAPALNIDGLMESLEMASFVIPAKAGIQEEEELLDPGFRRGDNFGGFLRTHQL